MLAAVKETGNRAVAPMTEFTDPTTGSLRVSLDWTQEAAVDSVLVEGDAARIIDVQRVVAQFDGKVVPVLGLGDLNRDMLVHEIAVSINTAAAGGNASLMALSPD